MQCSFGWSNVNTCSEVRKTEKPNVCIYLPLMCDQFDYNLHTGQALLMPVCEKFLFVSQINILQPHQRMHTHKIQINFLIVNESVAATGRVKVCFFWG